MTDTDCMQMALKEAHEAAAIDEVPIGAIVVCNDRVIARAHNMTEHLCDVTAHAEMQALTAAANYLGAKYLPDCTLYVTVEPCPMCAAACRWAQIGRVVYGAPDEKRGYSLYAPNLMHPKTKITKGILEDEAVALMRTFFINKR